MHQISHLFIPVVSLVILFNFSFAVDSLTPTETLSDGQTLVSSGQRFELGFFSPGNSTKRYLGIWYKKTPSIVVWVANRNYPVMGSSGLLMIRNGGELAVVNETKNIFRSSGSTGLAQNPIAQILYTGNFVVMERNEAISGRYIWQSFDYPTDTRLPGAMMGRNLSKGQDIYLSSWKTADDPSRGNFVYRFDLTGLPQLVLEEGSIRKYRTGPWNGLWFSGAVRYNTSIILPSVMVFDNQKSCYMYQPYSSSVVTRAVISPSGLVNWYLLDQGSNGWSLLQSAPSDPCDTYGRCGANGFCRVMKQSACECLKGFTPKFPDKWELLDWSAGCMRSVPLNCGERDGFFKLVGVKFPDLLHIWLDNSLNLKQCEAKCLSNCSCTAYANSNVSGGGSGCLLWFGDLMDITDSSADDTEQEVHLRLPASELRSVGTSTKKIHVLVVVLSVTSGMLILVFLVWLIIRRRQIHAKGEDLFAFDFNISARATRTDQTEGEKPKRNMTELEIPVFSFSSVSVCTSNFSSSNKLGEGGFGPVYKGNLLTGHVAVKRLSGRSVQGWDELKNEAVLIAKLQHKNLVRLLGCCIEGDENILIYEYLANKSLDIFLFDSTKPGSLDWRTRSRIIEGVAQGLLYLHEYSRLKIIHRDLKASNILLDKDMNPKISDFGMARIFGGGDQGETNRIVGTYGYMAPEYALHGIFSVKSDVFSFGVLLLEILSGKKNTHFYNSDCLNLLGYAWDLWSSGRHLEVRDPTLQSMSCDTADALFVRYIKIALLCVQEHATDRPTMSEVVSMLSNQQLSLPSPKRPAFSNLRSSVKPTISDESSSRNCSTNLVTSSIVQAR